MTRHYIITFRSKEDCDAGLADKILGPYEIPHDDRTTDSATTLAEIVHKMTEHQYCALVEEKDTQVEKSK